ncbi:MAG: DUF882 domain-containing protein [Brasilonema angustatum HA4187-MV1]|jgi:peptidoglycan hydrolase-like protein with peptidoglycan-binding domain|nr:DUF882 domain-containing protein [Brasilonema angustatum HA4187-MV1]
MKLAQIIEKNVSVDIAEADSELVKQIQEILTQQNYYKAELDGIPGLSTKLGLQRFKTEHWLEFPSLIGKGTALCLLEGKHPIPKDTPQSDIVLLPAGDFGTKTGRTMTLPNGDKVFANQQVIPHSYITWGEMSKGCTRVPETNQIVRNMVRAAKGFTLIREKFGSPVGVTSGYRTPYANKECGGVKNSQHLYGNALDIFPMNGKFAPLLDVIKASDAVGVGIAGAVRGFYHVDWRAGERVVFYYG